MELHLALKYLPIKRLSFAFIIIVIAIHIFEWLVPHVPWRFTVYTTIAHNPQRFYGAEIEWLGRLPFGWQSVRGPASEWVIVGNAISAAQTPAVDNPLERIMEKMKFTIHRSNGCWT